MLPKKKAFDYDFSKEHRLYNQKEHKFIEEMAQLVAVGHRGLSLSGVSAPICGATGCVSRPRCPARFRLGFCVWDGQCCGGHTERP